MDWLVQTVTPNHEVVREVIEADQVGITDGMVVFLGIKQNPLQWGGTAQETTVKAMINTDCVVRIDPIEVEEVDDAEIEKFLRKR